MYWFPKDENVLSDGYTHWIERYRSMVRKFAYNAAERRFGSADQLMKLMIEKPELGYNVLQDAERWTNEEKIKICMDKMATGSQIIGIMGDRRQGKTALAWMIADLMSKPPYNRKIYTAYTDSVPPIATRISGPTDCPEGGVFIGDEMHMHGLDSRRSTTNTAQSLTYLLTTLGHGDRTIIMITQDSSLLDKRAKTLFNFLLLKKLPKNATDNMSHLIDDGYDIMLPKNKQFTYFQSDTDHLRVQFGLTDWWSDKWSKAFSILEDEEEAMRTIIQNAERGSKETEIVANLAARGYTISLVEVQHIVHQHNIKLKKALTDKYQLETPGQTAEPIVQTDDSIRNMVDMLMGGECETSREVWQALKETGWTGSMREVQNIMLEIRMNSSAMELAVTSRV